VSKPEEILAKSKTELDSYEACRMHVSPGKLVAFVKELSKAKSDSRNLPSPRYLLEAICVALADSSFGLGSSNLGLRIERLEKMVEAISQGEQVLPAQQQKIEQAPTAPEDAAQPAPEEFPQLAPQEASLASFQKELAFASNYIAEQGKDPYMSQIFKMLRVVSYSNGVLTIAPTKDAIAHMGYFNDKNGEQKIADIIKGRNGLSLTVQIADNGDIPPIDFFSEASQAFGELTDFDG
jgi:DNA polymerase III gamma/tau subunit